MTDKLAQYRQAASAKAPNVLWPLYAAGFENLGKDGQPLSLPLPPFGPDQLLIRHDAVGLCASDIKVIRLGAKHPRIFRDIQKEPVVLGHEVAMTVVGVGENLREQYKPGDRFIIQADIFIKGVNYAYGYMLQGGLSRYGVIDQRILNGDGGNYLIHVQPGTGYAESALTEPWACVIATYRLRYRSGIKPGGTMWIIGAAGAGDDYTISAGFDETAHPARLLLSNVPPRFSAWLQERAARLGIEVTPAPDVAAPPLSKIDDIIMLGADPDLIESAGPFLATGGVFAIINQTPLARRVHIDLGRVHYDELLYAGGKGPDIARAYTDPAVDSELKPHGWVWFAGAGGPMGRMHVQRAIESPRPPSVIVCSERSDKRREELCIDFAAQAGAKGIKFVCLDSKDAGAFSAGLASFQPHGFDDIIILIPVATMVAEAADYLAPGGVLNVFTGLTCGTMAEMDLSGFYLDGKRCIGHSASTIEELDFMLHQAESGQLTPNRSVAAIGSLSAVPDGLQAVSSSAFAGKVVIFPQIKHMPLTPLANLKNTMPSVYALLKNGREWTVAAENEFLRIMLED